MIGLLSLKNDIKTEAVRLGFTHMGVAPAVELPYYDRYLDWIQSGKHADMAYLSREDAVAKRANPQHILDGCQRVISLAMPYYAPQSKPGEAPPGKGRISAYALTQDYHTTIWNKLSQLEDFIRTQANQDIRLKSYVDTGPILERAYAALAGMGTIGKNGCFLIRGTGSYFFLAEILIDLELPADPPYQHDPCKSCRRCIDACPTGCILENRTIDANRCISYLTIENRGKIPDDLKPKTGAWVFGCDVCQMVCPHNAQISTQSLPPDDSLLPEFIDLVELLCCDDPAFEEKYKQTPLSRAKRKGLLRNAAVVLGNQKFEQALPALQRALEKEDDPAVIDACRWAIKEIQQGNENGIQEI